MTAHLCPHEGCEFPPHDPAEHPCGRRVVDGVTRCSVCDEFDGSAECEANGCWRPATQADLDALIVEGMLNRD